jgi:hypothetical protein
MKQQNIKVLVGGPLQTCKWSGDGVGEFESVVNLNVEQKLFAVGQHFEPTCKWLDPINNGVADQHGSLGSHLD